MSYYADLFLRPKQAARYAWEHPSLLRSVFFIVLGTLAGILATLVYFNTFFAGAVIVSLGGDLVRWIIGGMLFLFIGMVLKKQAITMDSFSKALSLLAQLNVYGFFLFLIMGIILPIIAIPELVSASNDYTQGIIGDTELIGAVTNTVAGTQDFSLLAIPLILLSILLLFYSVYMLYLSVQTYFQTTVLKTVFIMGVFLFLMGLVTIALSTGF